MCEGRYIAAVLDPRSRRTLLVVAALTLVLSGCSLTASITATNAAGKLLHRAPQALARSSSVGITLTASSQLEKLGALVSRPKADPGLTLSGQVDLRTGLAVYTAGQRPVAVFAGKQAYGRRPHARPTDARPWIAVTLDDHLKDRVIDPAALPASSIALALKPTVLVDALAGALTGSIKKLTDNHYTARFDLVQAVTESKRHTYSQREVDDLAKVFEVFGIQADALHDGEVWLDDQGVPRRLILRLHEEPAPKSLLVVTLDLTLTPSAKPAEVSRPDPSTVSTVPSLFQYLSPLVGSAA